MSPINGRSHLLVAAGLFTAIITHHVDAETIIKLNLGSTSPDVKFEGGVLQTVIDPGRSMQKPGDQDTSATFHGFVQVVAGLIDITPPSQSTFTLSGVGIPTNQPPVVIDQGAVSILSQATVGGSFSLFDEFGGLLLTGTLEEGALNGTTGTSATGGFLTANLGTFTGPSSGDTGPGGDFNRLFKFLEPGSASLSISLGDVLSSDGTSGFVIENNRLMAFTADATANVGAEFSPEPGGVTLTMLGVLALSGFVRERRRSQRRG